MSKYGITINSDIDIERRNGVNEYNEILDLLSVASRRHRKLNKLDVDTFAKQSGISRATAIRIESGVNNYTIKNLSTLLKGIGYDLYIKPIKK